jgi:hypothetical protein
MRPQGLNKEAEIYRQNVISRGLAIIVGLVMFFALPITLGEWQGYDWGLMTPTLIVTHGVIGSLVGFVWPREGWRLGFYLCASWPPILLVAIFFGEPTGESSSRELLELLKIFLMFVAACVGAGFGAFIRRRRSTRVST